MNTITLVKSDDLRDAASEVEDYVSVVQSLGYPAMRDKDIPRLMRRAATELEILKAELWQMSQGQRK
jgi:uncharacterized protein (UPF0147 family)